MVKIRLTKLGRHKLPTYRIVAIDSRKRRDGEYLHLLGTYSPTNGKANINEELAIKLLSQGAQPCDTVLSLLKKQGIYSKYLVTRKVSTNKKKRKISKKKANKKAAKKNAPKNVKSEPAKETK